MCVCVCVCERERERGQCVCVCVCVWNGGLVIKDGFWKEVIIGSDC